MNKIGFHAVKLALPLVLGLAAALPAVAAQQKGLVNVSLSNVANDLAKNLSVDVDQIPVSVQVPVGVAANICDVNANVLAEQKKGDTPATCEAKSTSQALNQVVQKQIK